MTIQDCTELFMPKWLGQPMYPGGAPVRPDSISIEGATMRKIYFRHSGIDPEKFGERQPDDENILIAYTLYYINAPVFELAGEEYVDELRKKANTITSFEELWQLCIDYGLDPF